MKRKYIKNNFFYINIKKKKKKKKKKKNYFMSFEDERASNTFHSFL